MFHRVERVRGEITDESALTAWMNHSPNRSSGPCLFRYLSSPPLTAHRSTDANIRDFNHVGSQFDAELIGLRS
jgi:hypothetical protein